jgi:oxygen-independent coproporphyrinogen-3 oxidase
VSDARLAASRRAGVNRVSFGVQSFRDEELRRLSRLHDAARARRRREREPPASTTSAST